MRAFQNIWQPVAIDQQIWRSKMTDNQSLAIEIGAGVGYHAIQFAQQHQNQFIIPIERTQEKAEKMLRRVQHHPQLNNIYPVYDDAIKWICENIQNNEVSEYFILYPNPYPKAKQANKRFMHMPFMHFLINTLKTGGTITLATNMDFYYQEAKQMLTEQWGLQLIHDEILNKDFKPRTHFEKKYLEREESCYNIVLQKHCLPG